MQTKLRGSCYKCVKTLEMSSVSQKHTHVTRDKFGRCLKHQVDLKPTGACIHFPPMNHSLGIELQASFQAGQGSFATRLHQSSA
jgi:hypothetical protein